MQVLYHYVILALDIENVSMHGWWLQWQSRLAVGTFYVTNTNNCRRGEQILLTGWTQSIGVCTWKFDQCSLKLILFLFCCWEVWFPEGRRSQSSITIDMCWLFPLIWSSVVTSPTILAFSSSPSCNDDNTRCTHLHSFLSGYNRVAKCMHM